MVSTSKTILNNLDILNRRKFRSVQTSDEFKIQTHDLASGQYRYGQYKYNNQDAIKILTVSIN